MGVMIFFFRNMWLRLCYLLKAGYYIYGMVLIQGVYVLVELIGMVFGFMDFQEGCCRMFVAREFRIVVTKGEQGRRLEGQLGVIRRLCEGSICMNCSIFMKWG